MVAVFVVFLVAAAGGAGVAAGAEESSSAATPISECTTIDEPGEYVVTENVSSDDGPCLTVVADDVRVDGGGHSLSSPYLVPVVEVSGAANVSIENFVSWSASPGVSIEESSDVIVRDATFPYPDFGVEARDSTDVVVEDLRLKDQFDGGFSYVNVSGGAIRNTTVTEAADIGGTAVTLENSTGVTVENNELGGYQAIILVDSDDNTLRANELHAGYAGSPEVLLDSSSGNVLTGHRIDEFRLAGTSEDNLIYNNRFSGWREAVEVGPNVGENQWNTTVQRGDNVVGGRFLAGNYYSTFGSNSSSYSETCTDENGDGICDEPLELADGNVDAYPLSTNQAEENVTYYQVDLVAGDPIEELGDEKENDYSKQGRLVRYAHGTSNESLTERGTNLPTLDDDTAKCVESEPIAVDEEENTATVEVTVQEGCEVELSLVSYEKAGPGWSLVRQPTQQFADSETETLGPGTHTLTVDLPDRSDETDD